MSENKTTKPETVEEDKEAIRERLVQENEQLKKYLEEVAKENQILRATVKAMSQLL